MEGDCGEADCGEVDCGEADCGEGEWIPDQLLKNFYFLNNLSIRFLIQKEILYYAIPILSSWVECEADVGLVLDELMIKDLTLSEHKNR